jgi:hypothetical protein
MATTYSTNLALTLQGTNDNPGTWGNITNTNLGTLIEQAISGYVTQAVATGTDTTITIPNGSSGVARNMYIELTGTGGTNTNLIVPSNKKLYFIYNNTSSGQVTVKVSGQTGVSVGNGDKVILVCDGTDIVEAIPPGVDGETTASITALGVDAGTALTSGSAVVTLGYKAGESLTSGNFHTLIGHRAGATISTLGSNTLIGYEAGSEYNQSFNTFVGVASGRNMNSTYNTAIGYLACRGAGAGATGGDNVAIGNDTLTDLTTGSANTCVGAGAGTSLTTGGSNTLIGSSAAAGSVSASGRIVIGKSVTGTANNRITIGSSTNIAELDLDGSDTSWAASSDERLKENIQTSNIGLDLIASLRPVSYQWKKCKDIDPDVPGYIPEYNEDGTINPDSEKRIHGDGDSVYFGFIAQEARDAIVANDAEIVRMVKEQENSILTVAPGALIPALVKAIQDLKAEFDEYKRTHP